MMSWDHFVVLDMETTGVDAQRDRCVEVGVAAFRGRALESARSWRIHPGVPIPEGASAVHGITDAHVTGEPPFGEVWPQVLPHLPVEAILVTFNGDHYDLQLCAAELERAGHAPIARVSFDVRHTVEWHHRDAPKRVVRGERIGGRKLGSMCERYGITLDNAHAAAADCVATGLLLLCFLERGLVPDDLDQALAENHAHRHQVEQDWERYGYTLYTDRQQPDRLRVGFGRQIGSALDEVDIGWLQWALRRQDPPPPAGAAAALRQRLAELRGKEAAHLAHRDLVQALAGPDRCFCTCRRCLARGLHPMCLDHPELLSGYGPLGEGEDRGRVLAMLFCAQQAGLRARRGPAGIQLVPREAPDAL